MKYAIALVVALGVSGSSPLSVHLSPQNDSHEAGTAVLTPDGAGTRITISIGAEPSGGVQPANVHNGDCAFVEQIRYALNDVRDGRSVTVIPVSLHELLSAPHAIVVQDSAASLHAAKDYKYVSCAAIK